MTELAKATSLEIMALVDEYPSEPFSLDRKWLIKKLEAKLIQAWDAFEDESSTNYDAGYDNGFDEGKREAEEESEETTKNLEARIEELEAASEDLERQIEDAFAEGLEAGIRSRHADVIEIN